MRHTLALAVCLVALAVSWPARANTIFLQCADGVNFTVDLINNTVNNYPAQINPTSIDWQQKMNTTSSGVTGDAQYHIDRITGTYSLSVTLHSADGSPLGTQQRAPISCTAGSAPATKF